MTDAPRPVERRRWQASIVRHLEDFPRQYAALESAMGTFGDDFDLPAFKQAFETGDDMEAYNRVQALERAVGRVQNFVAELAEAGVRLAALPPAAGADPSASRAFEALRDADVIDGRLCRRLTCPRELARRSSTATCRSRRVTYTEPPSSSTRVLATSSAATARGSSRTWHDYCPSGSEAPEVDDDYGRANGRSTTVAGAPPTVTSSPGDASRRTRARAIGP